MIFAGFMTSMVVGLLTGSLAGITPKDGGLIQLLGGSSEAAWFVMAGIMFVGAAGVIAVQRTAWPRQV
jgi:hypothetical protein